MVSSLLMLFIVRIDIIYCDNLQNIYIKVVNPPIGSYYMFDMRNSLKIYVPLGSFTAYKTAAYWEKYATIIEEKDVNLFPN